MPSKWFLHFPQQMILFRTKSSHSLLQSRNSFEFPQVQGRTALLILHLQSLRRHLVSCSSLKLFGLVVGPSNRLSRLAHVPWMCWIRCLVRNILVLLQRQFGCRLCSLVNKTFAISSKRLQVLYWPDMGMSQGFFGLELVFAVDVA